MRPHALLKILATVCSTVLVHSAQGQDVALSTHQATIQLPTELKVRDQVYEDINHDGLPDLALAVEKRNMRFARSLRIHYQSESPPAFKTEPDHIIPLTPDVIAYAIADVDPHPGAEILLFTANACFGYRLGLENNMDRIFKIADCDLLWQIPDPAWVFSWQRAILDCNGDHKPDIFLPQANGLRVLLQEDSGFRATPLLKTPPETHAREALHMRVEQNRSTIDVGLDIEGLGEFFGMEAQGKPLVTVSHAINVPLFADFNGDRLQDILVQTAKHLHIWPYDPHAGFPLTPLSLKLPQDEPENKAVQLGQNQYFLDLNQDDRCDCILFARDKHAKKVFTQILVYLNQKDTPGENPLFGPEGTPQQLLKIAGLPGTAQLADIDSDGYPDISFITFSPDALDQMKTLASKSISFQFLAYLNHKGRFSPQPDMSQEIQVSLQEKEAADTYQGKFLVDLNQDGLLDCLVRDTDNHIELRLLQKTRNGLRIAMTPVWEMNIPAQAQIIYETTQDNPKPALLIRTSNQVTYVRFK